MLSSTSSGASSLVARTFSNRILAALGGFACLFLLIGVLPISTVRPAFALALHPTATQDNAQLLSAVIAGLQRKYSRMQSIAADFSQSYIGSDGRSFVERGRLILNRPGKAPEEFRQLLAEVDPESFTVIRLVIFQRNGTRMSFVLSNMRENPSVTNDEFKFNPPAGVKIRPAI